MFMFVPFVFMFVLIRCLCAQRGERDRTDEQLSRSGQKTAACFE